MINLYQILNISPYATEAQIRTAIQNYKNQSNANPKVIQAATQWLLITDVRQRYDARLQTEFPQIFQTAQPHFDNRSPHPNNNLNNISKDKYADDIPRLWNPKAAAIWSFFLSPVLGVWLHAQNWRELGDENLYKRSINLMWILVAIVFVLIISQITAGVNVGLAANVAMWSAWFFGMGKKQIDAVSSELGGNYDRKPWFKVLMITALLYVGCFVVITILIVLAVIAGVAHPSLFE